MGLDTKYIIDSKIELNKRIIKESTFVPSPPKNLSLYNKVAVYNDGRQWKVIPLSVLLIYTVIYDKHFDKVKDKDGNNIISDISITFCPYTFCSIIYFGKYTPVSKIYNGNVVLKNEENILLSQMKGTPFIRKKEVKIMILRNVISNYPDCSYFDETNLGDLKSVIDDDYIINQKILYPTKHKNKKFHPKTLIYGIEYKSKDITKKDYKYSAIVGKNNNSFNFVKSGFVDYFDNVIERIRNKGGVIIPCFWYGWTSMHGEVKIIQL